MIVYFITKMDYNRCVEFYCGWVILDLSHIGQCYFTDTRGLRY